MTGDHAANRALQIIKIEEERTMKLKARLYLSVAAIGIAVVLTAPAQVSAQQAPPGVTVGATDIGGVVSGRSGPEAGVWVIAETTDLPTKFTKIVVTDDQGRYVIPDLPKAKYKVWVRGYGLVDSPKVDGEPGKIVNLTAVVGAEREGGGAILSADLLVLDAEGSGAERVSRHRRQGQRHRGRNEEPAGVAERHQDHRLHVVSRARHRGDAHDLRRISASSRTRPRRGSGASSPDRP